MSSMRQRFMTSAARSGRSASTLAWGALILLAAPAEAGAPGDVPGFRVSVERGHPWRPPFGLERVGRPVTIKVEATARPEASSYFLAVSNGGNEVARQPLHFPERPPYSAWVALESAADEAAVSAVQEPGGKPVEVARQAVAIPEFEADAVARSEPAVNPVDLGTVLVPRGWLLLGPGQRAELEVAAISRARDVVGACLKVWFESTPGRVVIKSVPLRRGARMTQRIEVPEAPRSAVRDSLAVLLDDGNGRAIWRKAIPVMLVQSSPWHPQFGATYERLRYDAPISVRDPATGTFSSLPYETGWSPSLNDVVVWLPNGARFVLWRGSSDIPFWAGRFNTGACYEWAEIISQPAGAVDCVEPLMDKELRYGRIEIVESTPARVHVRWSYQSTDFHYKVWGDAAVEDYYFYPDGFGTRVLTLTADPKNDYELSEFILLTPQGTYPFAVLPDDPVDALFLDGRKQHFRFPNPTSTAPVHHDAQGVPAIYRLRLNRDETLAAISFNPNLRVLPPVVFAPFFDKGEMVTPCYWGSHWPLARGNSTGRTIDDRIAFTPCHNSVMSWAGSRPAPLRSAELITLDTLGRSRPMTVRRWAWLIGMSDDPDDRLVERASSFAVPPSLELRGARLDLNGYSPERRAIGLVAAGPDIEITIKPGPACVNPVFEIAGVPAGPLRVELGGQSLGAGQYAWDGRTFWLGATIAKATVLRLSFGQPAT
jgi:hypothetical protein